MEVDKAVPVYNKYFFKLNLWVSLLSVISWWTCLLIFIMVAEDDYSLAVLCCLTVAKLIAEVQVLAQGSTCVIYGGQSGYWDKFSFTLGSSPATYHFSNASYFSLFRSWYSLHVEVCSIKFLSLATLLQLTNLPAWLGRQQSVFFVSWSCNIIWLLCPFGFDFSSYHRFVSQMKSHTQCAIPWNPGKWQEHLKYVKGIKERVKVPHQRYRIEFVSR